MNDFDMSHFSNFSLKQKNQPHHLINHVEFTKSAKFHRKRMKIWEPKLASKRNIPRGKLLIYVFLFI